MIEGIIWSFLWALGFYGWHSAVTLHRKYNGEAPLGRLVTWVVFVGWPFFACGLVAKTSRKVWREQRAVRVTKRAMRAASGEAD